MNRLVGDKPIGALRFADGREVEVMGENARYWLCKGTQFRKSNPAIAEFVPAKKKTPVKKSAELEEDSGKGEGDTDAHTE